MEGRDDPELLTEASTALAGGPAVIERLCLLMARGCFPCSDQPRDLWYSDYRHAIVGHESEERSASMVDKLENPANEMLAPLRWLRGYEGEVP